MKETDRCKDLSHLIGSELAEGWKKDIIRTLEDIHEGSEYSMVMRDGILEGSIPTSLKYRWVNTKEEFDRTFIEYSKSAVLRTVRATMDSNIGIGHSYVTPTYKQRFKTETIIEIAVTVNMDSSIMMVLLEIYKIREYPNK